MNNFDLVVAITDYAVRYPILTQGTVLSLKRKYGTPQLANPETIKALVSALNGATRTTTTKEVMDKFEKIVRGG